MPLAKPEVEDLRKIHAEVNQIVNQRFLLVTLAITVFGAITTWIIPKQTPMAGESIGGFAFVASSLLSLTLFLLFFFSHRLKMFLRVLTSYLAEVGGSQWEIAWREYRKEPHSAYTDIHTGLFMALTFFALVAPFVMAYTFELEIESGPAEIGSVVIGVLALMAMYGIGFRRWLDNEDKAAKRWRELNQ